MQARKSGCLLPHSSIVLFLLLRIYKEYLYCCKRFVTLLYVVLNSSSYLLHTTKNVEASIAISIEKSMPIACACMCMCVCSIVPSCEHGQKDTLVSADCLLSSLPDHILKIPESVPDVLPRRSNLPTSHQLLSDQLRSGQVFPSDIAVPPNPGGRYRSMNTTFQRSNEQAPIYELPPIHTLATTVQKNISNMNVQSSPGFDPFSTSFIKHAEKTIQDDRGKRYTENVLLPLLTDLFHLFLSDGITPHLWNKVIITLLHKKGPTASPENHRLLAINGCFYRLFANVVRDLLTDWALAKHQIPDSRFGFCPTRNTNQPLFILRHILATA